MSNRRFTNLPFLILAATLAVACGATPASPTSVASVAAPTPIKTAVPSRTPAPILTEVAPTPFLTQTDVPADTKAPETAPTPIAAWNILADLIAGWPANDYGLAWMNETELRGDLSREPFVVTEGEDGYRAEPRPEWAESSTAGSYILAEENGELILRNAQDSSEIARTSTPIECSRPVWCVRWSPDTSALAFVSASGDLMVWETDGSGPLKVGETNEVHARPNWSPDSSMVAVLDYLPRIGDYNSYNIGYRDGRPMVRTGAQTTNRTESSPRWATNSLVVVIGECGMGCAVWQYYDALSGRMLASASAPSYSESPSLSPDGRWLITDNTDFAEAYRIKDLTKGAEIEIADQTHYWLDFLGWSGDGESFFAVKREIAAPGGTEPVELASALVQYWPRTDNWSLVVDNVMQAIPNSDRSQFVVAAYSRAADQTMPVNLRLVDQMGSPLAPDYSLGVNVPPEDTAPVFSLAAWNSKETTVILVDIKNNVLMLGPAQESRVIGQLRQAPTGYEAQFLWSPNDEHILAVVSDLEAWILTP